MLEVTQPKLVIRSFDSDSVQETIDTLEAIVQRFPPEQVILVEIDSPGGSAYGALRLIEAFQSIQNPVCTYCRSVAMSAGLILMATIGTKGLRYASPFAQFMLHEMQDRPAGGDIKDIENDFYYSKALNETLMGLLAESMELSDKVSIRSLIRKNTDGHDLFLNAQQAVSLKIIDDIKYITMVPDFRFALQADDTGRYAREEELIAQKKKEQKKLEKLAKKEMEKTQNEKQKPMEATWPKKITPKKKSKK